VLLLQVIAAKAQVGLRVPPRKAPPLAAISKPSETPYSLSTLLTDTSTPYPRSFLYSLSIDSTGQFITITRRLSDRDILFPRFISLNDYISHQYQTQIHTLWNESVYTKMSSDRQKDRTLHGLTIQTPRIRSEWFKRFTGGDNLSLNVKGNITIDGHMRHDSKSQVKTANNRPSDTNFQMKQTQKFDITGKIGENVSVMVHQDSENLFEFENAVKLQYTGGEDGIVKNIEAGNVALSLPGTRFVTFNANNTGLFGIKTDLQIGRLGVTAIASMEKGKKEKLSLTGGAKTNTITVEDYNYKRFTYFFLDDLYKENYQNLDPQTRAHLYDPNEVIKEIEVYKSDSNYEIKNGSFEAWTAPDPDSVDLTLNNNEENIKGYFLRLEPVTDFHIMRELGYIAMKMPLQDSEILSVAYTTESGKTIGTFQADSSTTIVLKTVKGRNPNPRFQTWDLEWKNVYDMGIRDITQDEFNDPEFDIRIYHKNTGVPEESILVNGIAKGFLEIFGLDNTDNLGNPIPDDKVDNDPNILSLSRGELILPNLRPFDPDDNAFYPYPDTMETYRTSAMYDTTNDNYIRQKSQFYFEVTSKRKSPNYELGMNVLEESEEVYLNGTKLTRGVDYTIEYMSGILTLLNPDATNPDANIEINYESPQLLSPDKKSLVGARAEYTLWGTDTRRSFIGGTVLYLNQTTLDQRVRLNQDAPMKNLVWDVNTALNFEPRFLTKALDALPLLNLSAPSTISLEGEIAQVVPNPNTLNNKSTGDNDGVAYLDDFEGAKRQITLGVIRNGWKLSTCPTTSNRDSIDAYLAKRGHLIWYNPYEKVQIQEIWPDREVTTNMGGSTLTDVLSMEFQPNPSDSLEDKAESWGGIQKGLSPGYFDQTDSRFLEIWVDVTYNLGRMHIDLGQISEDVIPNQQWDNEDKKPVGGIRNELLDDEEDTGLDGMFGPDPPLFHPHEYAVVVNGTASPYDFWDINGDGIKQSNEPWSYDDWHYESGSSDYSRTNGTEGNKNDGTVIYPDSEDLNRNSDVDLNNNYFEYTFDLDSTSQDTMYIVGGKTNPYGWRQYRIPLSEPSSVTGNPDWMRVEFARIWIDDVRPESIPYGLDKVLIRIAEITLAGNEWKLRGVLAAGDSLYNTSDDSTMSIAVINTHDNEEYTAPEGVEGVIDPIQRILSKEQSLVIKLQDLEPKAQAIAQKIFYQPQDLIHYKTLKMFVHGGDAFSAFFPDSVEFFLQLGSDSDNKIYYEICIPNVRHGWKQNDVEVQLNELTRLKDPSRARADTLENGHILRVEGEPSLSNIRWMMIGVRNNGDVPLTTEIWLDELRLSNVRKDNGMAMRVRADIKLSDFITINGEYNRNDADFHTINERFGKGSNSESGNLNAGVQLHKLLPESWGVSLPVSFSYSKSKSTPKYVPGTDILVKDVKDDSLLQTVYTESKQQSLNVRFSKRKQVTDNFWVRHFVNPIQSTFNFTQSDRSDPRTKFATNIGYKGSFSYDLTFDSKTLDKTFLQPFKWLGDKGILKPISQLKFFYLPSKILFSLDGNTTEKSSETNAGVESNQSSAVFTRKIASIYQPLSLLTLDYARTQNFDMLGWKGVEIFTHINPGIARSATQTAGLTLRPKLLSWFNMNTIKYSANYQWDNNPQSNTGQTASVKASFTVDALLDPDKLVKSFKKKSASKVTPAKRPVRRAQPTRKEEDTAKQEPEQPKEKKPMPLLSLLSFVGKGVQMFDPLKIRYQNDNQARNYGILGIPKFSYQIGTNLDPGVDISENVSSDRSSRQEDQSITFNSGIKITPRITVSFDYSHRNSVTESSQTTGTITESALSTKNNVIPFLNWSANWSGLETLPLLSVLTQSVSLTHAYSGKKTVTWNEDPENITDNSVTKDFRPLIGVAMKFKNNMTADIRYTNSETRREKPITHSTDKNKVSDLTITLNYQKQGGLKLPFIKKPLKNSIDFSLKLNSSFNGNFRIQGEEGKEIPTSETTSWSVEPDIRYSFSRTVEGSIRFEFGERSDMRIGKNKFTGFGIKAIIKLN
jgi:cell surface protein SprA